ncbi:M48 family metallopeptidase [Almyronema epifaneia]|uniref:M48 family metallopeptidase n=1 Tax=Almyronema epifaneia S1 TaxID=2991925 RepID=A0ABW6IAI7_9CYAN
MQLTVIAKIKKYVGHRWLYGLMATVTAFGITIATPQASQAGLFDILFNGIQYIQLSNMSDRQEVNLGQQIDAQLRRQGLRVYSDNSAVDNYVDAIGARLVPHSDRPNIPFNFQVVRDNSVNAFATVGGQVYIHEGLIREADNEAELAGVIAHEIGHITGRHAIEQMKQVAIQRGILGAIGADQQLLVNIGVELALNLPNSRADERDADRRGFDTMGQAGYDQRGLRDFMQKLAASGSPPEFLSTHPNPSNRVQYLSEWLNEEATPTATAGMDSSAYQAQVRQLL